MKRALILASVVLAGCATVEEAAVQATTTTYNATLTGDQEVGPGDPDASAKAEVSVARNLDRICYQVRDIRNIGPITAAHIHEGAMGENGPPVITLNKAPEGGLKGCTDAPQWLQDAMKTNFTGYYVNIHTADYPNGAIRGQLGL
ncbi:CHRD domain-containing protein [Novosphingobium endophyticum]|uniref:CHRD domain-containing protein n=1 Tax=Novosphingobium endophyticum TaxID=1955250 RepID=A0A916TQ78_9SPHN|nr:CHRD domain-containing protein [Novosphingobium endophyticum]GGB92934.1 CHRD domain-containing protein [Novosphingobium endophyticum]